MTRTLLALAFAFASGTALAQPPLAGSTYTFLDPIYTGTVFCDTFEQVQEIAKAAAPDEIYKGYLYEKNDRNEPVCLAIVPTASVVDITHLGIMHRDGKHFRAWAVKTNVGGVIAWGLYLEHVEMAMA